MYKALIYSDVHWSAYSSIIRSRGDKYSIRLHNLINSMNWVEKLAVDLGVNEIISCGDFFDTPSINAQEITALQDVTFSSLPHTMLVGNHESNINSLEYSSTKFFDSINAFVIDKPFSKSVTDKVDFTFIPYITGQVPKLNEFLPNNGKKHVVFAHQEVAGLQYGKFISQSGFNVDDIIENTAVFIDGHLHNEQLLCNNRIVLVGNLTGNNFNEDATMYNHLAYLLTIEDDGSFYLDPYENPYAFNFYKVKVETIEDVDKLSKLKNNAIVSIVCNSNLKDQVNKALEENVNILEHRITLFYTNVGQTDFNSEGFKVDDHFSLFIQFAQDKLEPSPSLIDELARLGGSCHEINI